MVLRLGRESALISLMWFGYHWGRGVALGQQATAFANARVLHHLEHVLRLPPESSVQALVGSQQLLHLANYYYVGVHFPLTIVFLLYGVLFRPFAEYRWARNVMAVQTGLALPIQVMVPLAPPRMFPQWGFLDSMTVIGPSAYGGKLGEAANQFAAMPSLHIGWAVLIAVVVTKTGPWWVGLLTRIHAVVTIGVVVVTANHWWLDGFVAVLLLGIALALVPGPQPSAAERAEDQSPLPAT